MLRVGDENAGFSVDAPFVGNVRVTGWGFWSVEVASAFASAVVNACRSQPRGATLAIDMSGLKPMREQGQEAFALLLRSLEALGISQTSVVTTNPLTKLQLVRIASESAAGARVEWIGDGGNSGRRA